VIWHPHYPSRIVQTDPSLKHQIVHRFTSGTGGIIVSCNCLRTGQSYTPLGTKQCWQPGEALQMWREHMQHVARDAAA